jgi:hypothetical protein
VASSARLRPAEQGLLWTLAHRPVEGLAAVAQLDTEDLEGLVSAPILRLAASLAEVPPDLVPGLLGERLKDEERALLDRAARQDAAPAPPADCVQRLKLDRMQRQLADVQDEIDRASDADLRSLWDRKMALQRELDQFQR